MIAIIDFTKKIHNNDSYKIVQSRSNLPMFVIDNPLSQDDYDEESERDLVGRQVTTTVIDFDVEDENDEPVKINKSIPQMVSDFISKQF